MSGAIVHTNGWGLTTQEIRGNKQNMTRFDGASVDQVPFKYWLEQPRFTVPVSASISQLVEVLVAAGAVTVLPDVGALTLTGFAPAILTPRVVKPGVGALTLTGFAPKAIIGIVTKPGVAVLTLTGFAPTVLTPRVVKPGVGTLTLTGFAPAVVIGAGTIVQPGTGALLLTGFAPTVIVAGGQPFVPGVYGEPSQGILAVAAHGPGLAHEFLPHTEPKPKRNPLKAKRKPVLAEKPHFVQTKIVLKPLPPVYAGGRLIQLPPERVFLVEEGPTPAQLEAERIVAEAKARQAMLFADDEDVVMALLVMDT